MHWIFAIVVTAVVAGALGYGFRGAIAGELGMLKVDARKAEIWAKQLETGAAAQIRAVAQEIRAELSKL
jgi:hypothetical protein